MYFIFRFNRTCFPFDHLSNSTIAKVYFEGPNCTKADKMRKVAATLDLLK